MEKQIKRLQYLNQMLNKYKHCWGIDASPRMMGWVFEYDAIRNDSRAAFMEFCKRINREDHNAGDCLA